MKIDEYISKNKDSISMINHLLFDILVELRRLNAKKQKKD